MSSWLDFFKKHSDALLKGAGQGLQASQNNDGIGANIGNALGQMATNKIVGHFNQGEKEDTPVTTTGGQIDTNISYRPTEPLPPKPASDWQSVLSGMNGQQEQTQPVTWQTYLSQQAGAQPEANTMFANVGDPLKKNIALSPYDQARTNVMEVANRPIENKDKGFKGWLKEFASNIGTGMQNAQKNNPNGGFLENLGASLGTGLTGGTVNRTLNEENQKNIDLQKAMQNYGIQNQIRDDELGQDFAIARNAELARKPQKEAENRNFQIEQEARKQANRISAIIKKDELNRGKYKIETMKDGTGRLIKKYPDREELFTDPDTGEQLVDPYEKGYDYTTEQGTRVTAKGSQILTADNTKAFRDSMLAFNQSNADANRTQQANIQNAQFDIEAQKTNVKNKIDYNNQLVSMATEIAKQSSKTNENFAEMNGYNEELQTTTQEISTIDPEKDPERYNKLVDKINNLSGKVIEAAGKTESGAKALQDLKNRGIQPPPLVKAPKVQAVKVQGKPVPKGKDPLGLFQ